jgi:queuine/archaeosine tRNA-ribosyltransferase
LSSKNYDKKNKRAFLLGKIQGGFGSKLKEISAKLLAEFHR